MVLADRPEMPEAEKQVMRKVASWMEAEEDRYQVIRKVASWMEAPEARCPSSTCVPIVDAAADARAREEGLDLEEAKRVMEDHDVWPDDVGDGTWKGPGVHGGWARALWAYDGWDHENMLAACSPARQ